jgi:hypothetical protein
MTKGAITKLKDKDVVRVKNAENWLQSGQPARALRELQSITRHAWQHPWTESVVWRAAQAVS